MRAQDAVVTIAAAAFVAAAVLLAESPRSGDRCPQPSARSVENLFAPCLATQNEPAGVPVHKG